MKRETTRDSPNIRTKKSNQPCQMHYRTLENTRTPPIRKFLTTLCTLIALCAFSSCSQPQQKLKNSLTIAMSYDPISLDPRSVYLAKDISIIKALYEGLTRETPEGAQLALAQSFTLSEDKTTYTFTLKPSKWSDGSPLTAYDFEESLKQLYTHTTLPSAHTLITTIKNSEKILENTLPLDSLGIRAKDPYTLEISLEKPLSYFLEILAHPIFYPVHKSLRESYTHNQKHLKHISNGPFTLSNYVPQQGLSLKKNPHYHESFSVHLDALEFKVVTDSRTALKLLQNHAVDLIGAPWSSALVKEAQNALPKDKVFSYPVFGTTMLIYNFEKPQLQSKALRKALAYAINKDAILQFVNLGKPAYSLVPPGLSQLKPPQELSIEERQEKARQYFQEAKKELSEQQLAQLTLLYPTEANNLSTIAQNIQQQLKQVLGLQISIQGSEYHCFLEQRKRGEFFIATGGWVAEYANPMTFLTILGDPHDLTKWKNSNYEALIKSHQELDISQSTYLAEVFVNQELPVVPLYHSDLIYATNLNLKNIFHSPLGYVDFKNTEIVKKKSASQT
ncbi:peptide ABC transporter, periplasmic binding protein [Chlamydia pecorum E58]|uniref:Peptide ABC transporter, periplasmic binding protein n=2 Tax=Chlamydia pecorum TaxID=85991 RepID=A0AA34WIE8_CHLPE|nr:peptide ABC transporter, periplasmic binding protein [Chlamydia pecorum E58]